MAVPMALVLLFSPCDTSYPYISLNIGTSTAPFLANFSEKKNSVQLTAASHFFGYVLLRGRDRLSLKLSMVTGSQEE